MQVMKTPNLETLCAIDAFTEEFDYFSVEAFDFIKCARELFTEECGEKEAEKVCWHYVETYISVKNKRLGN